MFWCLRADIRPKRVNIIIGIIIFGIIYSNDSNDFKVESKDCGGLVENFGGTITMMNMVRSGMAFYDCIWLIKPSKTVFSFKSHLYLKITKFSDFVGNAELQVRKGQTSESTIVETLQHPALLEFREYIYPVKQGYYVRLRALFGPSTNMAITYASFSFNNCFFSSEFLCHNYRCISKKLKCDGFDHCGDNSDEPEPCFKEWSVEPVLERWYPQTPNYYFPKIKEFTGLKTMALIILICLGALIFLMLVLMISFYQLGERSRRQGNLQGHLQPINELLDGFSDEVFMEDEGIDDPPCYEHPPNYEEVMKSSLSGNIKFGNFD